MTDSVAVFPPGFRLTDSTTGAVLSGAVIKFYDAETSTPKTVYADKELTTELGTSVTTDSLGYPTSDGTTKTLIYVGTAPYKVVVETSGGTVLLTHDNVKGALDTSGFGGDESVTASFPVTTKSLDYTVLAADQNKLFRGNCSGGDVTLTLPSAADVGNGWAIKVQHAGSANQVILATVSSETISEGATSFSEQFALALNGEEISLHSDGGNWHVTGHTNPHIKLGQGVLSITDRVSSAPGSPQAGALYLVASAYSTFSEGDILQYTGASYVVFTPYTDCGWTVWVSDEDLYYHFRGTAWVSEYATDAIPGALKTSTQAVQEAASATDTAVTPATQHFHPSAPKAWGMTTGGGAPTLSANYNMTSVTDSGVGRLTATIANDLSSANYAVGMGIGHGSLTDGGSSRRYGTYRALAAGSFELNAGDITGTPSINDPDTGYGWMVCGDL